MVQDSAGLLWFGTQRGLNRFDGRQFRAFLTDPSLPGGPTDDYLNALAVAPGGRLWLASEVGLDLFDPTTGSARNFPLDRNGAWPPLEPGDSAVHVQVVGVLPLPDGSLVAMTHVDRVQLSHVTVDDSTHRSAPILEDAGQPTAMCRTDEGALVAVGAGRLIRLDGSARRVGELEVAPDTVQALSCDGAPVIATAGGHVLSLGAGGWASLGTIPDARETRTGVRDIVRVDASFLWLATNRGLLQLDLETGLVEAFPVGGDGEIPMTDVLDLLIDRTGVVWVGTWNGVAAAHPLVRTMERALVGRGLGEVAGVVEVLPLPDDGILLGIIDGGGIRRFDPDVRGPGRIALPAELGRVARELSVWGLAREEDGTLWMAAREDGVYRWRPGGVPERVPYEIPGGGARTVAVDASGDVWAAANGLGLTRLDRAEDVFRVVVPSPADEAWYFWALAFEPDGAVWAGAPFEGLYRIGRDGETRRFGVGDAGLPSDRILTVTRTRSGTLWLGTEGDGLVRFDPAGDSTRTWTTADGLPHENVEAIVEDGTGALWISTNNGVALFEPGEGSFVTLRHRHGLAGNRFFANSGALTPDGRIAFGGQDGVTVIDPAAVRAAISSAGPSAVALTGLTLMGRDTSLALATREGGLRLDYDQNFFSLEFAAADYTDPSLNRYRYRLDPLDPDWQEAGNEPVATYTSVPPGRYSFEVEARNSYGVWTPAPALSIPVVVHPAFWQTFWFRSLVFAAAAGLIAAFFRYRYEQVAARARLRLDIAGKLHDDIGADLSTIALKTELVRATATLDERRTRQLEAASRLARETAHRVRETVWLVNTQYDTLPGLVAKLRDTADVMLSGQVRYDFVEPTNVPDHEVGMEIRQHVHLLFKETLNNLVKHAGARHVHIEVTTTSRELRFEVEDDGVGFDPGCADNGSGQRLMRERARAAHGSIDVRSAPGQGTRVVFTGRLR